MKVTVLFMLVLIFAAGKEGAEAKTCKERHDMIGCFDEFCNSQCPGYHGVGATGVCLNDPVNTCECTFPC
ncbi:hypothetical protein V6N11_079457 [Hibiscus sabdariffa]|uniref:Defensin-like protein n=1 Tax=Hibiscus sabdariffa TaxID=183260 RepID=A0ABR2RVK4_9ROSI